MEFISANTLKLVQVGLTNLCFVYSHENLRESRKIRAFGLKNPKNGRLLR